jgi:hypothetical protein
MRKWVLKVLLVAAVAAVIGCSQSACQTGNDGGASGDWPYKGPILDETGQTVQPPDWGTP